MAQGHPVVLESRAQPGRAKAVDLGISEQRIVYFDRNEDDAGRATFIAGDGCPFFLGVPAAFATFPSHFQNLLLLDLRLVAANRDPRRDCPTLARWPNLSHQHGSPPAGKCPYLNYFSAIAAQK